MSEVLMMLVTAFCSTVEKKRCEGRKEGKKPLNIPGIYMKGSERLQSLSLVLSLHRFMASLHLSLSPSLSLPGAVAGIKR